MVIYVCVIFTRKGDTQYEKEKHAIAKTDFKCFTCGGTCHGGAAS